MGSYLTVVNDTTDRWQCKVGADQHFLKVSSLVVGVFGLILFSLSAIAGGAPLVIATVGTSLTGGGGTVVVSNFVSETMKFFYTSTAVVTNTVGSLAFFTMGSAQLFSYELVKKGYIEILPGNSHRYGKMTLSLWQQSECIRMVGIDENKMYLDTLIMRPIFSGATHNSNRNYSITSYFQRNDTVTRTIIAAKDPVRRQLKEDEQQEEFVLLPNRTIVSVTSGKVLEIDL